MMGRKLKKDELPQFSENLDYYRKIIEPWCREKNLSLHKAFEISRQSTNETEQQIYKTLSYLWHTQVGKWYLRDCFKGGKVRKEKSEDITIN